MGTVAGIRNVAVNLLIGVVPIGILALINRAGWRNTYMLAGVFVFIVMIPVIYFFYINTQGTFGNYMYGRHNFLDECE